MTGPPVDPLADYQPGWSGQAAPPSPPQADPLADYHPAWKATPVAPQPTAPDEGPGYVSRLVTHILNTAQGIPGMEAVEAGAGVVGSHIAGHPLTYQQSLQTLRDATGQIGGPTSLLEHAMGSAATLPFLPANPAAAGGLLGGADQALSADPDQSIMERAGRTAVGAGAGALVGKALDVAVPAIRAKLPTKLPKLGGVVSSAQNVVDREGARSAAAGQNYAQAIAEGQGRTNVPAVHAVLDRPDIKPIVDELLDTPQFRGKTRSAPEVLDAVYKTLSDQAATAKKGLEALTPNKVNIGRFRLQSIKDAQSALLDVMTKPSLKPPITMEVPSAVHEVAPHITPEREPMSGPLLGGPLASTTTAPNPTLSQGLRNFQGNTPNAMQGPGGPAFQLGRRPAQVRPGVSIETPAMNVQTAPAQVAPAPMPTYGKAVGDYADASKLIDAVKRASDMVRTAGTTLKTGKNLARTTPEAFARWAAKASPEELQAAHEGILGALKSSDLMRWHKILGMPVLPDASARAAAAPGLLRMVNPTAGMGAKYGLLAIRSALQ